MCINKWPNLNYFRSPVIRNLFSDYFLNTDTQCPFVVLTPLAQVYNVPLYCNSTMGMAALSSHSDNCVHLSLPHITKGMVILSRKGSRRKFHFVDLKTTITTTTNPGKPII